MPPEIRETLFEPFVTLGKKRGTGLGLAVARRFVEDHGGTLELCRVRVRPRCLLPALAAGAAAGSASLAADAGAAR